MLNQKHSITIENDVVAVSVSETSDSESGIIVNVVNGLSVPVYVDGVKMVPDMPPVTVTTVHDKIMLMLQDYTRELQQQLQDLLREEYQVFFKKFPITPLPPVEINGPIDVVAGKVAGKFIIRELLDANKPLDRKFLTEKPHKAVLRVLLTAGVIRKLVNRQVEKWTITPVLDSKKPLHFVFTFFLTSDGPDPLGAKRTKGGLTESA